MYWVVNFEHFVGYLIFNFLCTMAPIYLLRAIKYLKYTCTSFNTHFNPDDRDA